MHRSSLRDPSTSPALALILSAFLVSNWKCAPTLWAAFGSTSSLSLKVFSLHALVICGSWYYKVLTKHAFLKTTFMSHCKLGKRLWKKNVCGAWWWGGAGVMLFILRGPFRIRKYPNSQTPGREHAPRTALQTEGTVQWKGQKKMASMELQWQCWPPGECRRTMHSRSVRVTNTGTGA